MAVGHLARILSNGLLFASKRVIAPMLLLSMTAEPGAFGQSPRGEMNQIAGDCPSRDFKSFVYEYVDNVEMQRKFINFPLSYESLDPADFTFSKEKISSLEKIPGYTQRGNRIAVSLAHMKDNASTLTLDAKKRIFTIRFNSESYLDYSFRYKQGCWYLAEISDGSY